MPALYLFVNGTALLYYQATTCPAGWGNAAPACVGVMRAASWRGPYTHVRSLPIVHPESEECVDRPARKLTRPPCCSLPRALLLLRTGQQGSCLWPGGGSG